MSEARLPPLTVRDLAPSTAAILNRFPQGPEGPIALFRTLAHSERVLARIGAAGVLDRGSPMSLRQREILVLRVSANCSCDYEWGVHAKVFAIKAGLDEARLADTFSPHVNRDLWDAEEQLLFDLADALHQSSDLDDALWQRLSENFPTPVLLEMILLCGFYRTIAYFNNGLRIAPETGTLRRPDNRQA